MMQTFILKFPNVVDWHKGKSDKGTFRLYNSLAMYDNTKLLRKET